MARRSQCSSAGDNPLDPNYLPPHYREEYRLAVDALVEDDLEGYYEFLLKADVVDFLSSAEIEYIQGSVRVPQYGEHPEQRFLEEGGDGSSDTYWPLHSDLDAPGLDLGWPQIHHFIGPTEVTTLVNPPEPDMPSIKEQARRLIKNATQVVAIAMDMFTDVDIFADILSAAMRNVAVYLLLDKENVHHFVNMVSNCRVDLNSIQSLRVRTVSGITYHCRSGKSFRGQMMDRFLLTDCRAVLSGNYSFMWSFEKLHRCMAHLFLGQLVSTFDEEFRILFAQSEPLMIDNMLPPMEDHIHLQKRKTLFSCERPLLYREPKKHQSLDTAHPEEWARHSHDERTDLDWRMMPLKRQEVPYVPADVYGRFTSQQSGMDPSFDQGPSRIAMMENPSFKRHSYAEGVHGRYSAPILQPQGAPELEDQGHPFHRGKQPYQDYSSYDRFWNQDFHSADQYSELGVPPEVERHENFDPVLNYLSSTRNADFERGSEKIPSATDLQLSSSQPRRLSLGQPYACQTSPTPSNQSDQKHFFLEPNSDRKDPTVKRGLRNWRISSFLSAYDNPGDDGLPSAPPVASDPFEDPSDSIQQTASGIELAVPKIPNVREFKIPALPRASQMPSYVKTTAREQPKKPPDQPTAGESKSTPTQSESSSTTEGEKTEEAEPKQPRTVQREESFRRKYNAAVQRSSRLRSSLIFSSLDQQHTAEDKKTTPGQQDEEDDKNEADQKKLPYMSQVFGQRRSTAREPFEWSRYFKSSTFDNSATDKPKADDGDGKTDDKNSERDEHSKDLSQNPDGKESCQPASVDPVNSSEPTPPSKSSEHELQKTDQPVQPQKPLFTAPVYVDMSDPDKRLMFFKELAAKRKAEKVAEVKASITPQSEPTNDIAVKKEQDEQCLLETNTAAKDARKTESTESSKFISQCSGQSNAEERLSKTDSPQSPRSKQTRNVTDPDKNEPKKSQPEASLHVSAETGTPEGKEGKLSNSAECKRGSIHPPAPNIPVPDDVPSVAHGTAETHLDSTSQDYCPLTCSEKIPSSWENHAGPVQSWSSESGSGSGSAPLSSPAKTKPPYLLPEHSHSTSNILVLNGKECVSPSASSISQSLTESTKDCLPPVSTLTSSEIGLADSSVHVSSDISPVSDTAPFRTCGEPSDVPESQTEKTSKQAPPSELHLTPVTPEPQTGPASSPLTDTVLTTNEGQTQRPSDHFSLPGLVTSDSNQTSTKETSRPTDLLYKIPESEPSAAAPAESPEPSAAAPAESPEPSSPAESPEPSSPAESPEPSSPAESPEPSSPAESPEPSAAAPAESSEHSAAAPSPESEPSATASAESPEPSAPAESPEPSAAAPAESPVPAVKSDTNSQNEVSIESEMSDCDEKKTKCSDVTIESHKTTNQVCSRTTNEHGEVTSQEVVPPSHQSKQQKSTQSRYHSSTANVLSSSNLRDDTKLLLEQISANSQSRNEATKESAVTDDDKEDEADKNVKRDQNKGIRSRGPPKSSQERDKLLERIQSMRKERKVYSRFEMAP
ncbi:protein FAM83H isoform X1 [Labrus mixtus]|uniref:protein FAM83H isoform X1 n=1 Tax=Labrus mixtus TaxID=508554 RepID=UPI0029BFB5AC|nr:protein FAM83H isoform X1 [Labrus mixtus]